MKLEGSKQFENIYFKLPSEGGSMDGTLSDTKQIFDGIACNDKHITTQLSTASSYISFNTPTLKEWSRENSIEFWFKVTDPTAYSQDQLLFSMVSGEKNAQDYYSIYIQNGQLKCAPFGTASFKDPVIVFTQFKLANQDVYGWWHVSCSYSFQQSAKGTLFNTNVNQQLEETMVGLPKFYPTNSIVACFGKSPTSINKLSGASKMLLKEFRFWNKQLTTGELADRRYRQVDPTKLPADYLLVYLRLATGSLLIENFASKNSFYTFDDFNLKTSGISFVEDFIETEKYSYDSSKDLVVSQKLRTYHTVCPVHTYYMKQYCYNEPVNQAILGIFPAWDPSTKQLTWEFSLEYSSMINTELITFLNTKWSSTDAIVDQTISGNKSSLKYVIPSKILRHESE